VNTIELASRTALLQPSPTLSINAKAAAMKAEGKPVISLAAGEPDFNTPDSICNAAVEAIHKGLTKYTATSGIKELKEAICEKLGKENSIQATPEQIVVSNGAKQSLFNAMMILVDPGDEVIVFAPYWMTYFEQIKIAGGQPVVVETDRSSGFVPNIDQIKEKISSRTKAIVINSPNNPTGAVWPRATLKEIASLALKHNLWIISDEIYEKLIYDGQHHSIAGLGKEIAERTITINGCSKSFAMTGWRIGFSSAPKFISQKISNLQDSVTSCANSFAQVGAVAAYRLPEEVINKMKHEFQERRDLIIQELSKIPELELKTPQGAFYVLPYVGSYLKGKFTSDMQLTEHILEQAQVAVVPGSIFGANGHLRLSYATSKQNIKEAVDRIAKLLHSL
jgi:aspartate aminotransferase